MNYDFLNNIVELLECHGFSEELLEAIQTESDSHIRKCFMSIEDEAQLDKLRDVIYNEMQEWHMLDRTLYGKRALRYTSRNSNELKDRVRLWFDFPLT